MWYKKKWGNDKVCGITFSRLRPGKNHYGLSYTTELSCKHRFYTKALIEWSKTENSCPLCRKNFNILDEIFGKIITTCKNGDSI